MCRAALRRQVRSEPDECRSEEGTTARRDNKSRRRLPQTSRASAHWRFLSSPDSVGRARAVVRSFLASVPASIDRESVILIVSELVTNAIRHATDCESVELTIEVRGTDVHVEVADNDPAPPVLHRPGPDEPSGRGLLLVDAMASRWGWNESGEGKQVWCEVDRSGARV